MVGVKITDKTKVRQTILNLLNNGISIFLNIHRKNHETLFKKHAV